MTKQNTAKMLQHAHCGACGWPIISACCNDEMSKTEPYCHVDYWMYCSNKACTNHAGEESNQSDPNFVVRE